MNDTAPAIAVVVPCYRVRNQVLGVLARIGPEVSRVYVIDDACPERSGDHVRNACRDPRVRVHDNPENRGVGGATMAGYRLALADGAQIVVKVDGDGQMDPALIPRLVGPIVSGDADYTKGNRFFDLDSLASMPRVRLFGNALLSLVNKIASGYWNIMDPTNGFTAIHVVALRRLPLDKIENRYFFESDMLFRLNVMRAVVLDVPMDASYGDEPTSMNIGRVAAEFPGKYVARFLKRVFYSYLLRDFTAGTVQLFAGLGLLAFGSGYGVLKWIDAASSGTAAASGVVMLAALPTLLGFQLLISAVNFDVANVPQKPLQTLLKA